MAIRSDDITTIIKNCEAAKFEGVELRTTHAHGVEVGLSKSQREEVRRRFGDSKVELMGLGSAFDYHTPDPAKLRGDIEATKEYIVLAHDVGASGVKVRPNGLPREVPAEKTLEQIGKSLAECGAFAQDNGIKIQLEVHGSETSRVPRIRKIFDYGGNHPAVKACWNSNPTDLLDGGFAQEPHPFLVRGLLDLGGRPLVENELPDVVAEIEQLADRRAPLVTRAAALDAPGAFEEPAAHFERRIEPRFLELRAGHLRRPPAVEADVADEPLREHAVERGHELIGFDAHVQKPPQHVQDVVGVHVGEHQVAGEGRVDGDHAVVAADDKRIVGVSAGMELEDGIVVDEVVQTACSQDKAQDHFSGVQRLLFVVDNTLLDQFHDTVADHLRVNAQVLLVLQIVEDRIRDLSDSQLQRRTVFDLPRNIPSYLSRDIRHLALGVLEDFVRRLKARRILELRGSGLWEGSLPQMRGDSRLRRRKR